MQVCVPHDLINFQGIILLYMGLNRISPCGSLSFLSNAINPHHPPHYNPPLSRTLDVGATIMGSAAVSDDSKSIILTSSSDSSPIACGGTYTRGTNIKVSLENRNGNTKQVYALSDGTSFDSTTTCSGERSFSNEPTFTADGGDITVTVGWANGKHAVKITKCSISEGETTAPSAAPETTAPSAAPETTAPSAAPTPAPQPSAAPTGKPTMIPGHTANPTATPTKDEGDDIIDLDGDGFRIETKFFLHTLFIGLGVGMAIM